MTSFKRQMAMIDEDITVDEFEQRENALVHMVFDGEKMRFPADDLNLNGMMITYDKRE
jgi:UDP-N-acetylglucosamine 2-epimerase (non-hydrolysing)